MTMKHVLVGAILTLSLVAVAGVDKKHVWGWRTAGNCKGLVRGNDAYCKDGDYKAVVRGNDAYCDSKDCKAIVKALEPSNP